MEYHFDANIATRCGLNASVKKIRCALNHLEQLGMIEVIHDTENPLDRTLLYFITGVENGTV